MTGSRPPNFTVLDANSAAAHVAYLCSDIFASFPITPATPGNNIADVKAASNQKNIFGDVVECHQMQAEGGVAGALHGAAVGGALSTTFTASQGLLLMVPNMYQLAGEFHPTVIHCASRMVGTFGAALNGDHSDVYACRQTGFSLLSANSVQEAADLAFVAHYSAVKSRVPVLHFYDGLRTSHEFNKIDLLEPDYIRENFPLKEAEDFRSTALSNSNPTVSGSGMGNELYWQILEAQETRRSKVVDIVVEAMTVFSNLTGREYKPFNYYGHPEAEVCVVLMGSGATTAQEVAEFLCAKGEKLGVVAVHLFRPFADSLLLDVIPQTVKRVCVLDKARETSSGNPLALDVVHAFSEAADAGIRAKPMIISGEYGICGFDFEPRHFLAVVNNLRSEKPRNKFIVGPIDDVGFRSLPLLDAPVTVPEGTTECIFWGLGSDGTIGASRNTCDIIGINTDYHAQAYFQFSARKTGGETVAHLRFGPSKILSSYTCSSANYIAVHRAALLEKFPSIMRPIKEGGVCVINAPWTTPQEVEAHVPPHHLRQLALKKCRLYTIDAMSVADKVGLPGKVNNILQSVFFKLSNVLPIEKALALLKEAVSKTYASKGEEVVAMNMIAIDRSLEMLVEIEIPSQWSQLGEYQRPAPEGAPEVVKNAILPSIEHHGHSVKVSEVMDLIDGKFPTHTTRFEKRKAGLKVPIWDADSCIACNQCAVGCPHQAIRPFIVEESMKDSLPEGFTTKTLKGKGVDLRIQVSPLDCLGCTVCTGLCPKNSLSMVDLEEGVAKEAANWEYADKTLAESALSMGSNKNYKDLGYKNPYMEFSGACAGCAQTVYWSMVTRMYGDQLLVAQGVGCSMVWGNLTPINCYTVDSQGKGVALTTSLFEDNAEFGYGIVVATERRRRRLVRAAEEYVSNSAAPLAEQVGKWLESVNDYQTSKKTAEELLQALPAETENSTFVELVKASSDILPRKVYFAVGGDGWAMDIDFHGLDHVLASPININILVYDTEVYSNTGGQASKATPKGAIAQYCASGNDRNKKDLGRMIMSTYDHVYVASIAWGYDMNHAIRTIKEAVDYEGPSLILAQCPCIAWGIAGGLGPNQVAIQKEAVETGFWPLYRYDPRRKAQGKNPLQVDFKKSLAPVSSFLEKQNRFASLVRSNEKRGTQLQSELQEFLADKHRSLLAMGGIVQ